MDANSYEKFKGIIAEQLGVEPEQVTPDASFVDDLNADSLDLVELIMAFEEEYGMEIPDEDAEKIQTVGAAWDYVQEKLGITTCGEMQRLSRIALQEHFGKFGIELYDLCRGIDDRPVEPDRERKSLSNEETFPADLETLAECEEKLPELFEELMADLAGKESTRTITKIFVKLKFSDFTRTTVERAGLQPALEQFRSLLDEAFARTGKPVRLIGLGVRFASTEQDETQLSLL